MSLEWLKNCVSVDIETAGPYPARYAMLSIGACLVSDTHTSYYVELKPDRDAVEERALRVSGLSIQELQSTGEEPAHAMRSFADWLHASVPDQPIFVAFNAAFDWMFINDYFHRYNGSNPFGHSAIDIKALYLGFSGGEWKQTNMNAVSLDLGLDKPLSHHALEDARDQAHLFMEIIARIQKTSHKE